MFKQLYHYCKEYLLPFLHAVLNVGFAQTYYTVSEDVGSVSVCVSSQGQQSGVLTTISVFTSEGTATELGQKLSFNNQTTLIIMIFLFRLYSTKHYLCQSVNYSRGVMFDKCSSSNHR